MLPMKSGSNTLYSYVVAIFIASHVLITESAESNGLGDHIDWQSWSRGLSVAKETQKPLMVVLHKSWCPACKSLKPKFQASQAIEQLSSQFVMINAKEGEEPIESPQFNVDGAYIPRVIFLDSEGNVLSDVINESGNPQYKYYHMNAESIVISMKKVLKLVKSDEQKTADEL